MLNRKFADLRHSPRLDPHVLSYDAAALPQAVVAIGPLAQRRQNSVSDTVAALDSERAAGGFPTEAIQRFRPPVSLRTHGR